MFIRKKHNRSGSVRVQVIEKSFRISKTDLRIRPMYHRRRRRIEAYILVSFIAYTIYKELERRLTEADIPISPRRAAELTQNIYEVSLNYQQIRNCSGFCYKWMMNRVSFII
jgi:transposase